MITAVVLSSSQPLVTSRPASMHAGRPPSFVGASDHCMYVETQSPHNGPHPGNPLPSPKIAQGFNFSSQQRLDEVDWYWRNISKCDSLYICEYCVATYLLKCCCMCGHSRCAYVITAGKRWLTLCVVSLMVLS